MVHRRILGSFNWPMVVAGGRFCPFWSSDGASQFVADPCNGSAFHDDHSEKFCSERWPDELACRDDICLRGSGRSMAVVPLHVADFWLVASDGSAGSRVRDSFEVYEECRFQWCGHSDIEFGIVSSKSGMLLYDPIIISAAPVVSGSGTQQDL